MFIRGETGQFTYHPHRLRTCDYYYYTEDRKDTPNNNTSIAIRYNYNLYTQRQVR